MMDLTLLAVLEKKNPTSQCGLLREATFQILATKLTFSTETNLFSNHLKIMLSVLYFTTQHKILWSVGQKTIILHEDDENTREYI